MYCFNCGIKVVDGASFCQGCGASVTQKFPDPVTEHDLNENIRTMTEIYPNPAQAPEFTSIPEPAAEYIPYTIPDADITPPPEQIPNPVPEPFPETVPDSFPDPTQAGGVSVTGITKNEINSYRYDANENSGNDSRSFTFSETEKPDEIKINAKITTETKAIKKEKVYFGKAAFVFCLLIITALSVLCGIFAGLYIKSSEKKTRAGAFSGIISEIYGYNEKSTTIY